MPSKNHIAAIDHNEWRALKTFGLDYDVNQKTVIA